MARSNRHVQHRRRQHERDRGFTMVELLVVIFVLAILAALLLPALNSAVKKARITSVGAEINQLAQALASFKSKYGDYPPSRVLLVENGDYSAYITSTATVRDGDITFAQLAQRSMASLRKFFPRVVLSTTGTTGKWYDFNGDGAGGGTAQTGGALQAYVLQGHEALVFFLGGVPQISGQSISMTGFGKNPENPFTNNWAVDPRYNNGPNPNYSANRQVPFFEFAPNRLKLDPSGTYVAPALNLMASGIPGYEDLLGNSLSGGLINFYAYFSAYGNGGYDPNDVDFPSEADGLGSEAMLIYRVGFPIPRPAITNNPNTASSYGPNPYTSTLTVPATGVPTFLNPQSYQIISSGPDGQYGVGGQYSPDAASGALPLDTTYIRNTTDRSIRAREKDNITNFHNGTLD